MNKAPILGNVGKDPEVRTGRDGATNCRSTDMIRCAARKRFNSAVAAPGSRIGM
jgi:single-stranded DNA-binding protein